MPSRPRPAPAALAYAALAYLATLAVLAYTIGFLAGVAVPRDIDQGLRWPWPAAAALDAALLLLFAVQHTVMARPAFKRRLTRVVPAHAERSTFVLAAALALGLLLALWRPLPTRIWALHGPAAWVLYAACAAGWLLAIGATFLISHTDMFGLRQAWAHARGRRYRPPAFTRRGLYALVRHPLMTGFIVVFWAAPSMTAGHLLFAAAATGYILAGIAFEERDLAAGLGEPYLAYRAEVPALVPVLRPRRPLPATGSGRTP
jgi:protein-S-isoprenylcysteine O-methyltransferase Ste14